MTRSGQVGFLASPDGTPRQGESPDDPRAASSREQTPSAAELRQLALPGPTQWIVWGALGLGGAYVLTKVAEWLLNPEDVVPNPGQCPVTNSAFGGISEDGGYGSATEYEIGARRIVEACRSILGELGKGARFAAKQPHVDSILVFGGDYAYIASKVERIVKDRREYSKQLYADRMMPAKIDKSDYLDPEQAIESARTSVYNIRTASVALSRKAARLLSELEDCDLPKEVYDVAFWCYALLEALAEAMLDGVEDFPNNVTNPFDANRVVAAVYMLNQAAEKFFAAVGSARRH